MFIISSWKDKHKNNVYKFFNFIIKIIVLQLQLFSAFIFSDTAHLHRSGAVNKQNCRFWCEENQSIIHEQQLRSPKLTVWCSFWSGRIIGSYFFRNKAGDTVTRAIGRSWSWQHRVPTRRGNVLHNTFNNRILARKKSPRFDNFKKLWHWMVSKKLWFNTIRLLRVGLFEIYLSILKWYSWHTS